MLTLAWGVDILFEKLTPEIGGWGGGNLKKLFALHYALGGGDFMQSLP